MLDEDKMIRTIILGSDWQEVLASIVIEEGMDPKEIDIIKLAGQFTLYLQRLQKFDFRVPARFILISAILLWMKCEALFEEEEEIRKEKEQLPPIDITNIPQLSAPIERRPTRKVTLDELITALNKAFEFKERKEGRHIRLRRAVETLIVPEEDIELKISRALSAITQSHETTFRKLVPEWKRHAIVDVFLPLLHLYMRGSVQCDQPEMFGDIFVKVKE